MSRFAYRPSVLARAHDTRASLAKTNVTGGGVVYLD